MTLPAKFRRALIASDAACRPGENPRLFIAYGDPRHDYVICLSGDAYDELDAKIQAMPDGEEERELLELLYYSLCDDVQVDEAGRFVLPGPARDKLNLDVDAVVRGKGKSFHILRPEESDASRDRVAAMLEKFGGEKPFFNPISLANRKSETVSSDGE